MTVTPRAPFRAASVILLREVAAGEPEAFMMRRPDNARFAPGAYAFPGGAVDDEDAEAAVQLVRAVPGGLDIPALHRRMANGGQFSSPDERTTGALLVAAARELFEEAGVLVARDSAGRPIGALDDPRWGEARVRLLEGQHYFADLLLREQLTLCPDDLIYYSHWITPETSPIRFNTHFFLAVLPPGQVATHWEGEMDTGAWIAPREALDRYERGEMKMLPVQPRHLGRMVTYGTLAAFLDHARTKEVHWVVPTVGADGREVSFRQEVAKCW